MNIIAETIKTELSNLASKISEQVPNSQTILFGSYARGDFDDESDMDFFILANVPQEDAGKWRSNIRKRLPLIDLEHDITVSLHVTGSSVFYRYADTLPYYMNVLREGVLLND